MAHRVRALGMCAIALVSIATMGCVARTRGEVVYEYPVAEVEAVPVDVYARPRVYYGGRHVYLVEDRWYYRTPRGWVVYREEPVELRRHRYYYRDRDRYAPRERRRPELGTPPPRRPGRYYPRRR